MDACKTFIRVNHRKLVDILLNSKVSVYIIRLIAYWYQKQRICNRREKTLS